MGAEGFEEAAPDLWRLAYQVAYRILRDRSAAEDAAAEGLARTWRRWAQVNPYAEPWVARVTANLALGELRRLSPRAAVPRGRVPAEDDAIASRVELAAALRSLTRRQRDVVVLRYIADLPEADVALLLGCSTGSVKTHASRGLAALRRSLGPPGGIDARLA